MTNIKLIMSECMQTDKPLISILMAVYEPNLEWFREQLESLESQTYPNLRLYVCDDSSQRITFTEIDLCIRKCIHSFPYEIWRNEANMGSNWTFERLTREAEGAYFAYCDQDDIWLPEKLEILYKELQDFGALLVCSDMYIIDGRKNEIADSITKIRRRHYFYNGTGLAEGLLLHNFVTGCTMLVQAKAAKAAVPFCPHMVHDHYLALWCAAHGEIRSLARPLIRYRIHGGNQTGILSGVTDKTSYGNIRITSLLLRLHWLRQNFPCDKVLLNKIETRLLWTEARQQNWEHHGGKRVLWRYRDFSLLPSVFELLAAELPEPLFRLFLDCGKYSFQTGLRTRFRKKQKR